MKNKFEISITQDTAKDFMDWWKKLGYPSNIKFESIQNDYPNFSIILDASKEKKEE